MKGKKKVIRIHNVTMAYPSFSFKGIEAYSTRAMNLCGGMSIVADCGGPNLLLSAHKYLRDLNLGSDELILVRTPENGDLYQAISENEDLCVRIFDLVQKQGYKIEFFSTRGDVESAFIRGLGLSWDNVISHPSALADTWNDKSKLRLIAKTNGLGHLFPPHFIVNSTDELSYSVQEILSQYPEVVIKRPLWAAGLGMVFGGDETVARQYRAQHKGVPVGTIVERSLGTTHVSMSIVARFEDGQMIDKWFTEQECPQQDGSVVYEGCTLGDMPHVTKEDTDWMEEVTTPLHDLIRREYPHLTGVINFDCLRYGDERFVLECNARITFSTYLQEIRRALLSHRGIGFIHHESESTCTCLARKIPSSARNFESLRASLGSTLLTDPNQAGVIPLALGCLTVAGFCYFVAVADSYQEALEVMAETKRKLKTK